MNYNELSDKIHAGDYKTKLPYVHIPYKSKNLTIDKLAALKRQQAAYSEDENKLHEQYRKDIYSLPACQGFTVKQLDIVFSKAWKMGHAYGLGEVAMYFNDLMDMVAEVKAAK